MTDSQFTFTKVTLNTIFPFYILMDENLIIKSFGNSIAKMMPDLKEDKLFTDYFAVIRPFKENILPTNFITLLHQSVIFTSLGLNALTLKGQFEQQHNGFIFFGSPWFMSLIEVSQKKIEQTDFAFHDSLLEILHVIENQEKKNIELKDLINTNDIQRIQLKLDKEELSKLSLVASANKNGVVFTKPYGDIFWCNEAFLKLTGFINEEIIGKSITDFGRGKLSNKNEIYKMVEAFYKGTAFDVEYIHQKKQGGTFQSKITGQPILDSKGYVSQYFAIIEDITDQKKLELQKEQLLKKLEIQNEQLNDYAHMVSHDLKSPLRSIHALITWIKDDNKNLLNETTLRNFELIEDKVEKMDNLIQGILTYSKIDSSKEIFEKIDLNEIVHSCITIIHIPENVRVTIKNKLPTMETDRFRMQQLFQNLISNAVNYNDKKQGFVEISYVENESDYIFSIKDNGQGINSKYQSNIFDLFQSFSNEEKSTGIGLSIVKRIITNHNGEIWFDSKLGIGTTFFIKLPKNHTKT